MAGRIAGITIEIGGDSTKLQNSLKGVDKSLKQTQTALKDIDKLLKFNPGNTELLVQKQRNLKKAIGETKERLAELRKAAENTTPEQIGQEKYDALQREIIDTENKLKSLTKEMHSFGSVAGQRLQAVGASMKELGGKIQNVGKELSTKVTAPILALGTASVMAFKEVDSAFDIVVAKTGATGDALKGMEEQVKSIAETMPVSFEDSATAIGEVNTRFGVTGEQLDEISRQFLKFAKINGTDVNTSIDTIQSAMAAFGLTADDTTAVLDAFNAAGQATGVPLDRLAESVKKNSATLQEMDLSLNDSITFLAQLDKSGMDSSTVMTGLRKALAKAAKEGKPMNQALQELQDSLTGATDETTASQMAIELFGTKPGAAIAQYVRNGQLDFSTLAQSAQDSAGSVSSTYDEIVDPLDEFTMALNQLKVIGMEIGSAVMPFISQALGILRDVLEKLKTAWESLSPAQQEMIVKVALIVAAIGPLLTVLGGVITAAGTIISVLGMLLSPIGLVIAAIAGLIAAGLWLHAHWDQVCAWANNLKERVTQAFEGLKANVTAKIQAAKNKVSSVVNAMKADVTGKVNALKSAVSNAFSAVHNAISSKMSAAKNAVSNAISAIKGLLSGSISFPHITLPHFTVTGSPPFGLGGKGSPPHISVEWYAKAMKQPYVLDGATIFGAMGGPHICGGEAGREMATGAAAFTSMTNMTRVDARLASIERILVEYLPAGQKIVMDSGELVGVVNRVLGVLYG